MTDHSSLAGDVDAIVADKGFAGVVHIDRGGEVDLAAAYGLAHRAHGIANTIDTRFAIASGSKAFTALAVIGLIDRGLLDLSTTARSVLGDDLPLIDDAVTVEHLLTHRSGIGDYVDEDADYDVADYVLPVPVHELATTEPFVPVLDGHPATFPPGERFGYSNAGYVVLALIAERVGGGPFHDLVQRTVFEPAGLADTAFLRSDELPGRTATGYLSADESLRTNVLHLPVRGNGDGGAYTTAADVSRFWRALFAGTIVPGRWVEQMVRPHSDVPGGSKRYGLGFWLHRTTDAVILVGGDAGVSFWTAHVPSEQLTYTVLANDSDGAWPLVARLKEFLN